MGDSDRHHLLLGRPARQLASDAALSHDDDAIADANDLRKVGGGHLDSSAPVSEVAHDLVDRRLGGDVDSAPRLAEHENLAISREPPGDALLLLVAARES